MEEMERQTWDFMHELVSDYMVKNLKLNKLEEILEEEDYYDIYHEVHGLIMFKLIKLL